MKKQPPEIRILTDDVANKIAAGEVVERPAAVVKELLESSMDANASHITVEIKSGGISYIRVMDDGCGMSRETLSRVTDPFCTSRKTRKVGMGIPLLRLAAEQTGGSLSIESVSADDDPIGHGTVTTAAPQPPGPPPPPWKGAVCCTCPVSGS